MGLMYKICSVQDFEQAKEAGVFSGVGIDIKDGYIHFSTADLLRDTLKVHFKGQSNLVVFEVQESDMPNVKWEEARGGKLFPHVYGTFAIEKARNIQHVSVDENGEVHGLTL